MKFTIFTGCYNSAPFIQRVFDSVLSQTYTVFEWIIVDDCSTDDTASLIRQFMQAHQHINIRYIRNEVNCGVAYGRWKAIEMATGDLFVSWDHDDTARPHQLQRIAEVWQQWSNDNISNLWALCEDESGKLVGNEFPQPIAIANYFDYYVPYIMDGQKPKVHKERFVCSRIAALRKVAERYRNESLLPAGRLPNGDDVWGMMALEYDTIFLNEVLRTYFIEPNRPSMSKGSRDKMAERVFFNKQIWLNYYLPRIPARYVSLKARLHFAYAFYGFLSGKSSSRMIKGIRSFTSAMLVCSLLLPARLLAGRMKG